MSYMSRLLISFSATKCVYVYMYAYPEFAVSAKHNGSSILIDSFEASMNGICRHVQQKEDDIAVGDCTIKEVEPKAQSGNQWSNPVRNPDINKPSHGPSNKPFQKEQFQQCGDYAKVKPVKTEGQAIVGLLADQDIKVWKLCHSIQNSLIVVYSWGSKFFVFLTTPSVLVPFKVLLWSL
jgi:hypothetical protein